MLTMKKLLLCCLFLLFVNDALSQQSNESFDIDRQELEKNRIAAVKNNLKLTPELSVVFWPIYDDYRSDVQLLDNKSIDLIKQYADYYNKNLISNEIATKLMTEFMQLDQKRLNLKVRYVRIFTNKLPSKIVWRYFHIENNLDTSIKNSYINQIPLVN